jgi:hypothetical protein
VYPTPPLKSLAIVVEGRIRPCGGVVLEKKIVKRVVEISCLFVGFCRCQDGTLR